MRIHPDLARLREGDDHAQPRTDAALAAWRARPEIAAVSAQLLHWDQGERLEVLPALARLMADRGAAEELSGALADALAEPLMAEPLAQLPFAHSAAPGLARLRLVTHGRAALTLAVHAPRPRSVPATALFEDAEVHEIVIAGAGEALLHRRAGSGLASAPLRLAPGARMARRGPDDARQIIAVSRSLLVLQLAREAAEPMPSREIALAGGAVVKTISGCKRTSQQVMALAVLGALHHRPALPAIAATARDKGAARELRWEGLRQCLALDAGAGMALLARLAGDRGDDLHAPAAALLEQLLASRPDLAALVGEAA